MMNRFPSIKHLCFVLVFFLTLSICHGMPALTYSASMDGKGIPEALPQKKKAKVKKPASAEKAQKQAEARDKQRRKESGKYIEENRKRSIEIQTPEVQERMKQNVKDANAKSKAKKKNNTARTRKVGRKYR
jgi:hypothetical protein